MKKENTYVCNINFTGTILANSPESAKEEFIKALSEYTYNQLIEFITVKKMGVI